MSRYVLQLCHSYGAPFGDVARQYACLFKDSQFKVVTVFLTGEKKQTVIDEVASEQVIFLENTSKELRGLKRKQIQQVKAIAQKYRFEFVIAHRYKSVFIACHLKNMNVIGVHHAFDDYKRLSRRFFAWRNRKQLFLLGVSNAIRDNLRHFLHNFPEQQIQTLYNRIDLQSLQKQQFSRAQSRKELLLDPKLFYYVNVGRLHPDKDQATLIQAFARVSSKDHDVRLCIYGKGRLEQELRTLISDLKLEDKVMITSKPHIAHYLKAFDGFVLSSDYEPFGMVLLEAMAAELPVISTQEGGAGEVVADTGLLFKKGDIEQLSRHMLAMRNRDKESLKKIKQKMLLRLKQHFTDSVIRENFRQLPFPFLQQVFDAP